MTFPFDLNLPLPTLGGKQLWADLRHLAGWRIQRHAITGHCRLLDPSGVRRAWGRLDSCLLKLEEAQQRHRLETPSGEAVVVLHGLGRTRRGMGKLAAYLVSEGFDVFNVSYPSTRYCVTENARNLASIVAGLAGASRVHFVGHSLGGILIRCYLAEREQQGEAAAAPPIGRVVTLASPHQGAALAARLAKLGVLHLVLGRSLAELGPDWRRLEERLSVPKELGIIAGCRGRDCGYNPLLCGDDDLVVSLEEARLAGAAGFLTVPAFHAFIMNHPVAQRQTAHFLRHGNFEPPGG